MNARSVVVSLKTIKIPNGRPGPIPDVVKRLADSIAMVGLLNPIGITEDNTLVHGRQRLAACEQLGWEDIPATVLTGDALQLELAEIFENLIRKEQRKPQQAEATERRKERYEALYAQTKHDGAPGRRGGGKAAKNDKLSSFAANTAKKAYLPVSPEYLALALADNRAVVDVTLRRKRITYLRLPTGKLVAADPFEPTELQPFELLLPRGAFPVILCAVPFCDHERTAFASIRFRDSEPVAWEMLTIAGEDTSELEEGELFGYLVDTGTGCFIDASATKGLDRRFALAPECLREMLAAMERPSGEPWSWLDMPFGRGNLVAFDSGLGDGWYATYAGFDAHGEISVVVTDSQVPLPGLHNMDLPERWSEPPPGWAVGRLG